MEPNEGNGIGSFLDPDQFTRVMEWHEAELRSLAEDFLRLEHWESGTPRSLGEDPDWRPKVEAILKRRLGREGEG